MTTATHQDNLFGICARVGEDFGFNPLWLRLAFASVLVLNPFVVIGAYFALGGLVLLSRIAFPKRAPAPAPIVLARARREHTAAGPRLPLAA